MTVSARQRWEFHARCFSQRRFLIGRESEGGSVNHFTGPEGSGLIFLLFLGFLFRVFSAPFLERLLGTLWVIVFDE